MKFALTFLLAALAAMVALTQSALAQLMVVLQANQFAMFLSSASPAGPWMPLGGTDTNDIYVVEESAGANMDFFRGVPEVWLGWTPQDTDTTGYNIYSGPAPWTFPAVVRAGNVTNAFIALNWRTNYIAVTAWNGTNESAFSNQIIYVPEPLTISLYVEPQSGTNPVNK